MTVLLDDDDIEPVSTMSDAKLRANRANAQKATGPRSDAGKQRSARNAEKHGAYSSGARAISRGPFAEDQAELDAFIDEFIESSAPRDALEREEVRRIAVLARRLRRVDRYEAEILSPPPTEVDHEWFSAGLGSLEEQIAVLDTFGRWAVEGIDDGVNFDHILIRMYRQSSLMRHLKIEENTEPEDNKQLSAKERVPWFMEHEYGGSIGAAKWAIELIEGMRKQILKRDAIPYAAARTFLAETDKVSDTTQRISRELDSATRRYQMLQKRVLHESHNPPNDPTDER